MRIDASKFISAPLSEGKEIAAVNNRRVAQNLASKQGKAGALPALELGQEIDAVVVEELDNGRLLLKLAATLIEAEGPGGLSAGQHVRLRVEQLQPNVVLQITGVEPTMEAEAARLVRAHLPAHADSGELLDSLQSELAAFVPSQPDVAPTRETLAKLRESIATLLAGATPPTPEKLEALARDSGLFYEAKLLDAAVNHSEQILESPNTT